MSERRLPTFSFSRPGNVPKTTCLFSLLRWEVRREVGVKEVLVANGNGWKIRSRPGLRPLS